MKFDRSKKLDLCYNRASKFTTGKIERSFEISKKIPLGVTFILLAMVPHIEGMCRRVSLLI